MDTTAQMYTPEEIIRKLEDRTAYSYLESNTEKQCGENKRSEDMDTTKSKSHKFLTNVHEGSGREGLGRMGDNSNPGGRFPS